MAVSEAQVHDKLAYHGLSLEERNTWWKTPLPELGDRTPADMFPTDPLAVKLCAEYGCISERPRRTVLTPARLWGEPARPKTNGVSHEETRHSIGKGSIFSDEAAGDGKAPEPARPTGGEQDAPDWWA